MTPARPGERLRDAPLKSTTPVNTNPENIRVGGPRLHPRRLTHDQLTRLIHKHIDGNPKLHINKAHPQETTSLAPETGNASYFQAFKNARAWLPDPVKFLKTANGWLPDPVKFLNTASHCLTAFLSRSETDRKDPAEKAASIAPSIPRSKREAAIDVNPKTPYQWYWLNRSVPRGMDMYSDRPRASRQLSDPYYAITDIYDLESLLKNLFDDAPIACGLTRLVFENEFHPDVFSLPVLVDERLLPYAWRSFYAIHDRFHGIKDRRGPVPVMVTPPLSCDPNRTASTASFNPASCEMFKQGDLVPQIDDFFSVNRTDKTVVGMVFVDPETIIRWVHESAFLKPGQGQIALAIVVFDEVFQPPRNPIPPIPQIANEDPVTHSSNFIILLTSGIALGTGVMSCCVCAIKSGAAKRCIHKIRHAD